MKKKIGIYFLVFSNVLEDEENIYIYIYMCVCVCVFRCL